MQELVDLVRKQKKKDTTKKNKNPKIPYDRAYYVQGGVPEIYVKCLQKYYECNKDKNTKSEPRAVPLYQYDHENIWYDLDKGVINRNNDTWLDVNDPNWHNQ